MKKLLILLIIALVTLTIVSADSLYKDDPTTCPQTYQSQTCPGSDLVCGYSSGITYCYDMTSLTPPAGAVTSSTQYSASYGGGYIIDCYNYDSGEPFCNNNGNLWCNRDSSCYNVHRLTSCTGGAWVTYTCDTCIGGYTYCDGSYVDGDGCEIQIGVTAYPSEAHAHYTSGCTPECDSGYTDCNTNLGSAIDGCEVQNGGACTVGGLPGTYSTCTCTIPKQTFYTGTMANYSTTFPLLWGKQYGVGALLNLTNSTTNRTFSIDEAGCIVYADGTQQCTASIGGGNLSDTDRINWLNGSITNIQSNVSIINASLWTAIGNSNTSLWSRLTAWMDIITTNLQANISGAGYNYAPNITALNGSYINLYSNVSNNTRNISNIVAMLGTFLTAETDPQVGAITASKWCTSADDGGSIICNAFTPANQTDINYLNGTLIDIATNVTALNISMAIDRKNISEIRGLVGTGGYDYSNNVSYNTQNITEIQTNLSSIRGLLMIDTDTNDTTAVNAIYANVTAWNTGSVWAGNISTLIGFVNVFAGTDCGVSDYMYGVDASGNVQCRADQTAGEAYDYSKNVSYNTQNITYLLVNVTTLGQAIKVDTNDTGYVLALNGTMNLLAALIYNTTANVSIVNTSLWNALNGITTNLNSNISSANTSLRNRDFADIQSVNNTAIGLYSNVSNNTRNISNILGLISGFISTEIDSLWRANFTVTTGLDCQDSYYQYGVWYNGSLKCRAESQTGYGIEYLNQSVQNLSARIQWLNNTINSSVNNLQTNISYNKNNITYLLYNASINTNNITYLINNVSSIRGLIGDTNDTAGVTALNGTVTILTALSYNNSANITNLNASLWTAISNSNTSMWSRIIAQSYASNLAISQNMTDVRTYITQNRTAIATSITANTTVLATNISAVITQLDTITTNLQNNITAGNATDILRLNALNQSILALNGSYINLYSNVSNNTRNISNILGLISGFISTEIDSLWRANFTVTTGLDCQDSYYQYGVWYNGSLKCRAESQTGYGIEYLNQSIQNLTAQVQWLNNTINESVKNLQRNVSILQGNTSSYNSTATTLIGWSVNISSNTGFADKIKLFACTSTDKISSFGADGTPVCTSDQVGSSSTNEDYNSTFVTLASMFINVTNLNTTAASIDNDFNATATTLIGYGTNISSNLGTLATNITNIMSQLSDITSNIETNISSVRNNVSIINTSIFNKINAINGNISSYNSTVTTLIGWSANISAFAVNTSDILRMNDINTTIGLISTQIGTNFTWEKLMLTNNITAIIPNITRAENLALNFTQSITAMINNVTTLATNITALPGTVYNQTLNTTSVVQFGNVTTGNITTLSTMNSTISGFLFAKYNASHGVIQFLG